MPQAQSGGALVTGANVVNETLSNDDIATNAAIAASKLNLAAAIGNSETKAEFIKSVVVAISSAEIKAMLATPKVLVAAPGAGKIIVPIIALFSFDFGTVQYANGGNVQIKYGTGGTQVLANIATAAITAAADTLRWLSPVSTAVTVDTGVNTDLVAQTATSEFITGDGTAKIFLLYREITL